MWSSRCLGSVLGFVCLAVLGAGIQTGCCSSPAKGEPEGVSVTELIKQVEQALEIAANRLVAEKSPNPPHLNTVTLSLQTAVTKQTGGGFDVIVLQLGTQTARTLTSKITLTLQPQFKAGRTSLAGVSSDLASAIVAAWHAEDDARKAVSSLWPTGVSCEVSFGVQKQVTGGFKLVVAPLTGSLGGTYSRETVQTISFSFQ